MISPVITRNGTDSSLYYQSIGVGPLIIWTLLHGLIALAIIFANALVIASFVKNANLRTRTNYLITSLALADLLVGLVSVPGWLVLVHKEQEHDSAWYKTVIEAWYVFEILGGVGSILHLMALCWDRLCAIVRPLRHRSYSKRKYSMIIFLTWFSATLVSGLSVPGNKITKRVYNMSVICLCFFLPLSLIFVAQGITLFTIKRKTAKLHQNTKLRRDVRAAKTIAIMIGLFLIGWLPFFTLGLVQFAGGNLAVLPAHSVCAVKLLQYSNSLFNPMLYGQNFPEFRNAYVRMLCSAKSNDGSFRFGGRNVMNRKTFQTTLSTYKSYSSPLPSKSSRSSGTWDERRDQRSRVPQKDGILVCMVSGL